MEESFDRCFARIRTTCVCDVDQAASQSALAETLSGPQPGPAVGHCLMSQSALAEALSGPRHTHPTAEQAVATAIPQGSIDARAPGRSTTTPALVTRCDNPAQMGPTASDSVKISSSRFITVLKIVSRPFRGVKAVLHRSSVRNARPRRPDRTESTADTANPHPQQMNHSGASTSKRGRPRATIPSSCFDPIT